MRVKATILDNREEKTSKCFLSRMSLEDYVKSLPSSYQDYDVQREIVSNVYLDHLVDTVLNRKHIPPIVLIVNGQDYTVNGNVLELGEFKIIDGLQRTFRLQAIRKTIDFCFTQLDPKEDYLSWTKFKFSRSFSAELNKIDSNTDVLRAVVEFYKSHGKDELLKTFHDNNQWFEIWTGLTPQEEVRKMLMLNAGHKPVKTRHQLELLFLNLLPVLREDEGQDFKLVREKEISATHFSKERKIGDFHFAHVITALLSLYDGKPVTPSTSLIQEIQSNDSELDEYIELTNPETLKEILKLLVKLDMELFNQYGEYGSLWMGREISLSGLFGAFGFISARTNKSRVDVMRDFYNICHENPKILNLEMFEDVRNSVDLSKVNIGNINRSAVYSATKEILMEKTPSAINWKKHFGMEVK